MHGISLTRLRRTEMVGRRLKKADEFSLMIFLTRPFVCLLSFPCYRDVGGMCSATCMACGSSGSLHLCYSPLSSLSPLEWMYRDAQSEW